MTELPTAPGTTALGAAVVTCPKCGSTNAATASFCEECGTSLAPVDGNTAPAGARDGVAPSAAHTASEAAELESPITLSAPVQRPGPPEASALETDLDTEDTVVIARPCANCGGVIGSDGYCQTCGTKAPTERDHYTEQPSSWVAACCDKGIRHFRNEDATAVASDPSRGGRAVLVVCDGVSTSVDSDVASLAAARAAREVLLAHRPAGMGGVAASRAAATAAAVQAAAARANAAVVETTAPTSENAASCTFAAAVIDGGQIVFGNVGDSRVYWLPDAGTAAQPAELSLDDSVAQARIAMGVSREEAENGPQAHAITKWLGRDSPDFEPRTGSIEVSDPGWLLVCSDGLWNYVSEATAMQSLVATLSGANPDPLPLSVSLVGWANEQGGKDNISVALARYEP